MRIAICGTRGIPACYGGFETFAEELSTRLVERGHEVQVFGRQHVIDYSEPEYRGVQICLHWAPRHKYLETPVHTLLSFLRLLPRKADVILVCNAANSPFIWIPRLAGIPVVVNLDGIERLRAKWNVLGRWWYRFGEWCSVLFASELIADAGVISRYYKEKYRRSTTVIPYGYRETPALEPLIEAKQEGDFQGVESSPGAEVFQECGLTPNQYILYVSRFEPENNAHIVVEAYGKLPEDLQKRFPLVMVGDAPYASEYIAKVKNSASVETRFLGFRFGEQYEALQLGARVYVQATEVGGTHPALVEAMGFANAVIVNDTPENAEVIAESGLRYEKNSVCDLSMKLSDLLEDETQLETLRRCAREHAVSTYSWQQITSDYEALFRLFSHSASPL